jgi:REP element-mobilizing transposase RayT
MTRPRSQLVSLDATPYYHCICRCVRRAFLMGKDAKGCSFDHRKTWLVERIKFLAGVFAIDIAAYAVMSNHYHLVLHVDKPRADGWSEDEVCRRWAMLYHGPELLQRYLKHEALSGHEQQELRRLIHLWRNHLCSLSRFMACLNYVIALHANREDGCTGRFWEGRFKSQALKDETALLACMVYVDLNPIRAGIARDLEASDFTSIQDRIKRAQNKIAKGLPKPRLMPFSEVEQQERQYAAIPFRYRDYLELADWYGRAKHPSKRGTLDDRRMPLLIQLGLSERQWILLSNEIEKETSTMLHGLEKLEVLERKAVKLTDTAA